MCYLLANSKMIRRNSDIRGFGIIDLKMKL